MITGLMDSKPRIRSRLDRWATLVLIVAPIAVFGCNGSEHEGEEAEVAGDVSDTVLTEESSDVRDPSVRAAFEPPYDSRFPHAEHRELECVTCHETVLNHTTHGAVECTDCHSVPVQFQRVSVPDRRRCLECHHLDRAEYACTDCHERTEIAGGKIVAEDLVISVWDEPHTRRLPFDHNLHRRRSCTECHSRSIYSEIETGCASCHENHHRPAANCASCHEPGAPDSHPQETHEGCGGSGCHQDAVVTALPPSRSLCLVCHQEMTDHESGGDCAECHGIRIWNNAAQSGTGGRARR